MRKEEKKFYTGFNNGYLIAKYLPEFITKMVKGVSNSNVYFQGLLHGAKEYESEKEFNRNQDLKLIRKNKNQKRNLERDR